MLNKTHMFHVSVARLEITGCNYSHQNTRGTEISCFPLCSSLNSFHR